MMRARCATCGGNVVEYHTGSGEYLHVGWKHTSLVQGFGAHAVQEIVTEVDENGRPPARKVAAAGIGESVTVTIPDRWQGAVNLLIESGRLNFGPTYSRSAFDNLVDASYTWHHPQACNQYMRAVLYAIGVEIRYDATCYYAA